MKTDKETKYNKAPDGCYLITDIPGNSDTDTDENDFAEKMLSYNDIAGLIKPNLRNFNGISRLYYNVTGLSALSDMPAALTGANIRTLLEKLSDLMLVLPDYCLTPDNLSFDTGKIFTDGKTFKFCYIPGNAVSDEENNLHLLSQRLIDMIDHRDEEAVMLAYNLYRLTSSPGGNLSSVPEQVLSLDKDDSETGSDIHNGSDTVFLQNAGGENSGSLYSDIDINLDSDHATGHAEGKKPDLLSLILFFLAAMLGAFILIWRGMAIRPFSMALLMTSSDGVGGMIFMTGGIIGLVLTFIKS